MMTRRVLTVMMAALFFGAGCSTDESRPVPEQQPTTPTASPTTSVPGTSEVDPVAALAAGCANATAVTIEQTGDTYRFAVTVRSADTGPEKYADAWEVRGPDGTVFGVRELLHDHVSEQPFTRSLSNVSIPPGITEVTVAVRDSVVGFCGVEATAPVPGR